MPRAAGGVHCPVKHPESARVFVVRRRPGGYDGRTPRTRACPMDAVATALLDRLRAGDRAAFDGLFELYADRLAAVAERHLSRRLAARTDGADVVQSAFRKFFRRNAG